MKSKPLIGVVHLPPLSALFHSEESLDDLYAISYQDAITLEKAGYDAIIIENFHDKPFAKYELEESNLLIMNLIVDRIRSKIKLPFGINILRNACVQAMIIANVNKASFIRCNVWEGVSITDQGMIEGVARSVTRIRRELQSDIKVLADVHVKHSTPLGNFTLEESAFNALHRNTADAIIVTGKETGKLIDTKKLENFVKKTAIKPILGSGLSSDNLESVFRYISGAIVGTSLKADIKNLSTQIDFEKALELSSIWKEKRKTEFNQD